MDMRFLACVKPRGKESYKTILTSPDRLLRFRNRVGRDPHLE